MKPGDGKRETGERGTGNRGTGNRETGNGKREETRETYGVVEYTIPHYSTLYFTHVQKVAQQIVLVEYFCV